MQLFRDLEFAVVSPYLDKKHNIKTAQDYKAFVWEKEHVPTDPNRKFKTKAEMQANWQTVDIKKADIKTNK